MLIKKKKKAFSLIEVVVASVLLSMAVFWVFKLIWENTKSINNSNIYKNTNYLFFSFGECIENIFWSWASNSNLNNFYLNLDNCSTANTSTWIIIDEIEYILSWKTSDSINFKLSIKNDFLEIDKDYRLLDM